jgi:hypothetical protein
MMIESQPRTQFIFDECLSLVDRDGQIYQG